MSQVSSFRSQDFKKSDINCWWKFLDALASLELGLSFTPLLTYLLPYSVTIFEFTNYQISRLWITGQSCAKEKVPFSQINISLLASFGCFFFLEKKPEFRPVFRSISIFNFQYFIEQIYNSCTKCTKGLDQNHNWLSRVFTTKHWNT